MYRQDNHKTTTSQRRKARQVQGMGGKTRQDKARQQYDENHKATKRQPLDNHKTRQPRNKARQERQGKTRQDNQMP